MIDTLAVIEEQHLADPDGNVERRLATIAAPNTLDVPTAKPSDIVRNWSDAMWGTEHAKRIAPDGSVKFCAIGILAETGGFEWGEPDFIPTTGSQIWRGHSICGAPMFVGQMHDLGSEDLIALYEENDNHGKGAAADWLEARGL